MPVPCDEPWLDYIEDPLAEALLSGEFSANQIIDVTRKGEDDHLYFTSSDMPQEEPEAKDEPEATTA